ncbi:hypothetical protein NX801_06775 [Streptomyces sp. LP05-1]|uniref:Cyclase n=1 Tax=Streptomyces pyxinae TaxID=2970734 RepID=A0ABT2CD74_9ACTN|nr:hypothetical protein [Streptomyces sp. LP05-1]MCS0635364.1 hypothetical protein [Streptomyces sp. LP05-1]
MTTLHIEITVSDYEAWKAGFDRFADFRRLGGVRHHRVLRQRDDAGRVVIDLDFDTAEDAERFHDDVRTRVWSSPDNIQGLIGPPRAVVLETVEAD